MTNEQCTNVAKTAWNLANEQDTDLAASASLRDCSFTIRELRSRIAELEKDAERYQLRLETIRALYPSAPSDDELDTAIDAAIESQAKPGMDQDKHLGSFGAYANENNLVLSPYGWLPKNIEDACAIRTSDAAQAKQGDQQ